MSAGFLTSTGKFNHNPRTDTTTDFYRQKNKKIKGIQQIGKKKETELEEVKWTDKVFTGDNPKLTAFLSG